MRRVLASMAARVHPDFLVLREEHARLARSASWAAREARAVRADSRRIRARSSALRTQARRVVSDGRPEEFVGSRRPWPV